MDAGVVSGLLQLATQGRLSRRENFSLEERREQKASHRERLRRRGAVCGVAAPPRCAPASRSSRLLASGPAALATPPTPFFSTLLTRGQAIQGGHRGAAECGQVRALQSSARTASLAGAQSAGNDAGCPRSRGESSRRTDLPPRGYGRLR